jgi:hypothetical protein
LCSCKTLESVKIPLGGHKGENTPLRYNAEWREGRIGQVGHGTNTPLKGHDLLKRLRRIVCQEANDLSYQGHQQSYNAHSGRSGCTNPRGRHACSGDHDRTSGPGYRIPGILDDFLLFLCLPTAATAGGNSGPATRALDYGRGLFKGGKFYSVWHATTS